MSKIKEIIRRQLDTSGTLLLKASSSLSDEDFFFEPENAASMAWTLRGVVA